MNADELKGKWEQFKGKLRERWSKLTDDDWQQVKGNKEQLVGKIQEKYGVAKDQAEKELDDFFNKDKDEHR
jgi:uncharacterized protein YjbJ (UPF0337 family)